MNLHPNEPDSSSFDHWFSGSKIVHPDGSPRVVYHGTSEDFSSFDVKKAGMGNDRGMRGRGFYFSPNERTAACYGHNIMQVYLAVKNPFDPLSFESQIEIADHLGIDESIFSFVPKSEFKVYQSFSGVLRDALQEAGYDGVMYLARQEIVAFSPDQIKRVNDVFLANQRMENAHAAKNWLNSIETQPSNSFKTIRPQ